MQNDEKDIFSGGKLKGTVMLERFRELLAAQLADRDPDSIPESEKDPRRLVLAENYFSALLLAYYNPVLASARGIVDASKKSATVRRAIGSESPLSLGSFSEAQHLFDADVLLGVIRSLRGRLKAPGSTSLDPTLSAEAQGYGVVADQNVVLGPEGSGHPPVRLITMRREGKLIRLVTTLRDADVVELCMLYRYRWEIETFFKWLKVILGTRGFLGESANAVTSQLYVALIMALLLAAFTGRRPNKRQMEAIQLFLMGWMTEKELAQALDLKNPD